VSPKPAVHPDGIKSAEPHVHVVPPDLISELARDAAGAWDDILAGRAGHTAGSLRDMITTVLIRRSVLPSQVLDRLTRQPVSSSGNGDPA
jgi:hypothetical protein